MERTNLEKAKRTNRYMLDTIKYLQQRDLVANNDVRLDLLEQLTKVQFKTKVYLKDRTNKERIKQLAELEHTFERLTFLIDKISKGLTVMKHYHLLIIILIVELPYQSISEEEDVWNYEGELGERTKILEGFCETI